MLEGFQTQRLQQNLRGMHAEGLRRLRQLQQNSRGRRPHRLEVQRVQEEVAISGRPPAGLLGEPPGNTNPGTSTAPFGGEARRRGRFDSRHGKRTGAAEESGVAKALGRVTGVAEGAGEGKSSTRRLYPRRLFSSQLKGGGQKSGDTDWARRGGRSGASSRQNSPPRDAPQREATRSRRPSRVVARQHSYDDDVKVSTGNAAPEGGLGLPAPMPRRASAYDVFTVPGLSTVTATSGLGRRASFRAPPPDTGSPPSPESVAVPGLALPEEDRRTRRRGSQL